jgi:hypothetical protein
MLFETTPLKVDQQFAAWACFGHGMVVIVGQLNLV